MPISGQIPLTTIAVAKEQKITYQPLLLVQIQMPNGGPVLRLSTENLAVTTGGHQYNGFDWIPRISNQEIGAISALSDNGIVQSPQIQLKLADADKFLWNEYETIYGFKGAQLTLLFVFWDPDTATFSTDSVIKFVGICDPPAESDPQYLTIVAVNKINLSNFYLPVAQISQQCIWTFPVDHAGRVRAAQNQDAAEFPCGYSPDVTDSDFTGGTAAARGNLNGGVPFTTCGYTWQDCIARMGNSALPTSSTSLGTPVQIEQDTMGRHTGTFGGIHYDPPDSWRGKAYTSGSLAEGVNQTNIAKFNDYYPQTWGISFIEPPVMNVVGDPNSTRMEVVLGLGPTYGGSGNDPGPIQFVIVNDFSVPFIKNSSDLLLAWTWLNGGGKFGTCNRAAIYNGEGDPYGSMVALAISVPNIVAGSNSVPSIQVLGQGPFVRQWNSTDPTDFTESFTPNFAWNIADILTNCGLQATDLDLQSFIDEASYCVGQVTYTDLLGDSVSHDRFDIGITVRRRRTAAEVLQNLLPAAKATLVPNNNGLLSLVIKKTLGDQQPSPVLGSNYNEPVDSADSLGNDKAGYFAYLFDESSILRKGPGRDSPSTFVIKQRSMRDTPNKVNCPFQDEDYSYAADSITVVDSEDVGRTGITVSGGVKVEGVVNIDQAKRCIETQLAEQFRGNPRTGINSSNDTGGTWIAEFDTNFRAIYLMVGQIIGISFAAYNLVLQPFRITAVQADANCEKMHITAWWHDDDWYLDSYGQNPSPILSAKHLQNLQRPPFGWLPNQEAPLDSDPIYSPTDLNFAIAQLYSAAADSTVIASLQMTGHLPVNKFSGATGPAYAPTAEANPSGGTFAAGHYYVAICAEGSDGLLASPSNPLAQADVVEGGSITIPNIYWLPNAIGYKVYAGTNPNQLSLQVDGAEAGTPDSITITAYNVAGEAMPDVMFDHITFFWKIVWHAGIWGASVTDVFTSTTLSWPGIGFTAHEYAGRVITIIGQVDSNANMPIWDFLVEDNDTETLTLGAVNGHTPDLVALGVQAFDVVVMRAQGNISSANMIGDSKFVNEFQYFSPPLTVSDASGSPILLTLTAPHSYTTGEEVMVSGVTGNLAANGTFTITVPSTADPSYNALHLELNSTTSSGSYEGGGQVQLITDGMAPGQEVGRLVRIFSGTGAGQIRKVISNDMTTLTVDTDWDTIPDSTSLFIVEDASTLGSIATTSVSNADPTKEVTAAFQVANYPEVDILVQAFSTDANGNLAIQSDSPFREIWVFGGPGTVASKFDKATFNLAVGGMDLIVADDVCPHYIVRHSGVPSSLAADIKVPSLGADVIIDIILTKADGSFTGSIFATTKIDLPAGSTNTLTLDSSAFATGITFDELDLLTVNVTQIGSTTPGSGVAIVINWTVGS